METKHTKGPWGARCTDTDDYMGDLPARSWYVHDPDEFVIAELDSCGVGSPEIEANARLIAAAPDLLARLEQALVYLEHPDVQAMHFCKPAAMMAEQMRAAIAKAEGGGAKC